MIRFIPSRPIRLAAVAVALAAAAGCTPVEMGVGAAAVSLTGPQAATGRNSFYWIDRVLGPSCKDASYFDRPVYCVNGRS